MLALIFRGNAHWTSGFAFKRALEYLNVPHVHINNNDVWEGRVSLSDFDSAICIDDGFALKPRILPNMPKKSAYFCIDLHGEPDAYLPYLYQFGKVYCAQYQYGVELVRASGQEAEHMPLAWDSLGIPYNDFDMVEPTRDVPIAFVASWSTETRIYWREIINHKYKGIAAEMYHKEMGDLLSRSKIGLNVRGGIGHRQYFNYVGSRPYEVMGCGSLLLEQSLDNPFTGEYIDDFERCGFIGAQAWFRDADSTHHFWNRKNLRGDENCVLWKDASQLLYTIDYYLQEENEQERVEIAERGRKFVTENHTYVHRTKTILRDLGYSI